ncbi:MAG: Rrf2 family transcriptional regulator [Archaeoglobus sp.]|nr:Rrf2 family transcriptional regulator [Archaeoglobus sp.]
MEIEIAELTPFQKEILKTLLSLHKKIGLVKSKRIARLLGRNEVAVRNQMQVLRVLGLVEGVPGPKGGYKPTAKAYETLCMASSLSVALIKDGELLNCGVNEVSLLSISDEVRLRIRVFGDAAVSAGDTLLILTPWVVFEGEISWRDDGVLLFSGKAREEVSKVRGGTSVRDAAKFGFCLVKVEDGIAGIITPELLVKAISEGKLEVKVEEIMEGVAVVDREASFREVTELLENCRFLVVGESLVLRKL